MRPGPAEPLPTVPDTTATRTLIFYDSFYEYHSGTVPAAPNNFNPATNSERTRSEPCEMSRKRVTTPSSHRFDFIGDNSINGTVSNWRAASYGESQANFSPYVFTILD